MSQREALREGAGKVFVEALVAVAACLFQHGGGMERLDNL